MPSRPTAALPAQRRNAARQRTLQRRRPRVTRLLAWLLATWLGGSGWALAQVAPSALPSGGQVKVGAGQITQNGNLLLIQQNTNKLGLDWQSFNIGAGATVEFRQPGASSIALNRVLGNSGSEIYGQLKSNGQVFLTNPNGVLFAPGARVDVGGLVASTLDLSQQDFAEGRLNFSARSGGSGTVLNQGSLRASAGGYVALFGQQVANQGEIAVDAGSVLLASGRAATVSISGSGLLSAVVTPNTVPGSVDNSGRIVADGGTVTLTAKSAQDIAASLVNNSGIVRANTLVERGGEIWITGDSVATTGTLQADATGAANAGRIQVLGDMEHGTGLVAGTISARSEGGSGGSIETSAAQLRVVDGARVDTRSAGGRTGHWLIDPTDFTIGSTGAQSASGIGADTLASNLASSSVTLATAAGGSEAGDIHVNADVNWSASTSLTLQAARHINLNASINASGASAGLVLTPAVSDATGTFNVAVTAGNAPKVTLSGLNATLTVSGNSYTPIRDLAGLRALDTASAQGGNYALVADIDASSTSIAGQGFNPIGNETTYSGTAGQYFSGRFDGLGHSISGLTVALPASNYTGLFASTRGATVRNLVLAGGSVAGSQYTGAVVGYADTTSLLHNLRSSASVSATDDSNSGVYAGGLVGRFEGSASGINGILNSSSSGDVLASTASTVAFAGGVVGYVTRGVLSGLTAGGTVSTGGTGSPGSFFAGGLVGITHSPSNLSGSLATGAVTSTGIAGGLAGAFDGGGAINSSRATGTVTGGASAGGLVGRATGNISGVSGVFTATGDVSGTGYVGGLVGDAQTSGSYTDVSARGNVTGTAANGRVGGLVGSYITSGSITGARAEGNVSGALDVGGLIGYASGNGALSAAVATGSVSASLNTGSVGGLAGYFSLGGGLTGSDASGDVSGGANTGGLVGYYVPTTALSSSRGLGSTVIGGANYAGGLIGYSNASAISGSSATASVTGGTYAGGLVGRTAGSVTGVAGTTTASGNVSGVSYVGGLVGSAEGTGGFTDVKATGSATGSSTSGRVGGLIGSDTSGGITRATATGNVSGGQYTGGLVGYFVENAAVSNVRAEGNVLGTSDVGGLIGYASSNSAVTDAVALGSVTASGTGGSVGGLLGFASLTGGVLRGDASGNVAGGNFTGGLVGYMATSDITNSNAHSSTVSGGSYVGGLVGYSPGTGAISGSSASASVAGTNTAGGLVGQSGGAISRSSATGSVTASSYAGGLVGQAYGSGDFSEVQASGAVQASNAGGLVGSFNGSGAIRSSQASGNVLTTSVGGGLVGNHGGGTVIDSSASGSVTGISESTLYLGGLIGQFGSNCYFCSNSSYLVTNGSASGAVRADAPNSYLGGLVGFVYSGSFTRGNTSVTSTVTAVDTVTGSSSGHYTGGLIGYFGYYSTDSGIDNSNARGAVAGGATSGGLVGYFRGAGITDSSATGDVTGSTLVGGLVGDAAHSAQVRNVSASGRVTADGLNSTASAGGLYGQLSLQQGGALSGGFASGAVNTAANTSNSYTGGLVGRLFSSGSSAGVVNDSRATGNVSGSLTGNSYTGGLVGRYDNNGQSPLRNSRAEGTVSGGQYAGGLIGGYYRSTSTGTPDDITSSYATGAVSGLNYVGGLVGEFQGAKGISGSYAIGSVLGTGSTGATHLGGLVGRYYADSASVGAPATLNTSYATGNVSLAPGATLVNSTSVYAGGLVGYVYGSLAATAVADSYATGAVTVANIRGQLYAGGLLGFDASQNVQRVYATGAVSATGGTARFAGGLLAGRSGGTVSDSYWNTASTGQATSLGGGTGVAGAAMLQAATFGNWSIASTGSAGLTWRIYEGRSNPLLTTFLTPLSLSLANASKTYDGNTSFGNFALSSGGVHVDFPDRIYTTAASADVGSYSIVAAGMYSVQNGYDLSVTGNATLTITPKTITLAGVVADKVYDGTRSATLLGTAQPAGLVAGEDLTVNLSAASALFDTKDAGQNKAVTVSGLTLSDGSRGKASNYSLSSATTTSANIAKATLNAGGFTASNRAYDGSTTVAVSAAGGTVTGIFGADDVTVDLQSVVNGSVANKNVGTAKAVTVLGASITGADAGNYTLAGLNAVTVDITPRALTVNGLVATNREYDRTVNVDVSTNSAALSGAVGNDVVQLQRTRVTGTMADKNVAYDNTNAVTTKVVNVAGSALKLRGADAANYSMQAASTTVTIQPYTLYFAVQTTAQTNRIYDGTANASVTPYTYYSLGGNDDLTLLYNAPSYSDKNVAYNSSGAVTSKTITVDGARLSGTDAGNYRLYNTSTTTSGVISPKALTVTGVTAVDRAYDGTRDVDVNVSGATVDTGGIIGNDQVVPTLPSSGTVVGAMATKGVGQAKPVTVPGFSLSGADAGNYSLTGNNGVTVNIAQKDLTASYAALDKVYDGNAYASINVSSTDIVAGDTVRFYADQGYCTGCYGFFVTPTSTPTNYTQSRDAGSNKRVIIAGNPGLYGADAANYRLVNPTATLSASITPKGITPVFTGVNKIYDGTLAAAVNLNTSASGVVSGDAVNLTRTATFDTKNVGTGKTVTITGIAFTGASAANYTLTSDTATTTASITVRTLTVQGVTAVNRAYDGTTAVALVAGNVAAGGVLGNDAVGVTVPGAGLGNGSMADKGIGDNKVVTVSGLTLNGADAGNYVLDGSQGVTVNITRRPLTASYVGLDRVYNAGVEALVTGSSADLVPGDNLLYTQNAVFTGLGASNVGSNKPISITGIQLGGTDAANYTLLNSTASTTGGITPKFITVSYAGLGRVYNGLADTSALVEGSSSDVVAVDRAFVTFSQQARFTGDGAVGTGKAVAVTGITLGGTQGGNYALNATTASTTANVTPRPIGVIGVTATNRVYDGTRTVAVNTSGATTDLSGVIAGDQVLVQLPAGGITTGTVSTKDAGNNKDVTITGLTLSGSSASNYIAAGATGLRVNITPKPLTALYSAANKVYDGNSAAVVSASSADILAGDLLNLGITATGVFGAGKNAGMAKTVLVSGGFLTGAERNNYALLNPTGSVLADITQKTLQASYQGGTRVYDGGVAAPVSARNLGVIQGDELGFTQTAVFTGADAKNVGTGKAVAVSNIQLTGADAGNYRVDDGATATTTASITRKPISIDGLTGATATDRVYDATRTVAVTVTTSGSISPSSADIVPGDQVQINLPAGGLTTGTMLTKDAGRNKPLVVDGLELTGTDARNYSVAATSGITVNIAARPLTAVWSGTTRVYDGSTAGLATGQSADLLAGDSLGIVASGLFLGDGAKNVGTNKAMAVFNGSLNGTDAANYTLLNNTGSTTASITKRQVTPGYIGLAKVYDGLATAQVTSSVSNFVAGDDVSLAQTSAVFTAGKNVGTGKAILVSGITLTGNDGANYALTGTSASTSADITPKPLRIEGLTGVQALGRVYNGSATVDVIVSSSGPVAPNPADLVQGDIVTVNAPANGSTTGTMADKNVGTAKPVSVAGLSLGGIDAANYSITATSGITVNITPRPVTASYSAGSRVYDGTVLANISGSSADLIFGDNVVFGGSGLFTGADAKNVGSDKAVLVSGGRLTGTDAANYSLLNPTGSTTGSITPRPVTVDYAGGSRVYDGLTGAPVTANASGLIGGDLAQVSQTAVFSGPDAKGVGVGKTVQVSGIRLDGIDAVNYALTADSATTTGTITPRPLRVEGFTGVVATDRVYDGTRFVAITVQGSGILTPNLADVVPGDDIGVLPPASGATAGTIADKNVGQNKPVTVAGLTLTGADAHNYLVAAAAGVTVNITPKPYTASYTALDKVYDGTAIASISGSSADLVLGDQLVLTASGVFTGAGAKNVGSGKAVAVSGGALGGADAANYSLLNSSASISASITPKQLTASYTGGIRVYDRSTGAPVTADSGGVIAGDDLQFLQTAEFTGPDARNVGTNKAVLVSGITLQGADRANYALTATTATTTATITPRPLSVSGLSGLQAVDRVYDGSVGVAITGTAVIGGAGVQVLEGDDVQLQLPGGAITSGTMLDKSAGQGKAVAVSGLRLSGADAANYQITGTAGLTVNIAPRPVVLLGVTALDRAYDGSTTVAIQSAGGSIQGGLAGDDLSLAASGVTGSMADKHVGSGKLVTVSGLSLSGADAANYTVAGGSGLSVNITPRALTATALVADKVYDGQTGANVTLAANGLVAGDDLRLDGSARYADANAGSGKAVSITGITLGGADAGDYALGGSTLASSGNITRRALSVTANSLSKMYGETVNLTGTEFSTLGLVAGESIGLVSLASAGTADTAGVAAGPYGISIGDARGGSFNPANYTLAYTAGTLRVTPRPLTVAGNNVVRYADEDNPASYGYAVSPGGLYGSDRLAGVSISTPEGSTGAPGGSIFELVPGNAVFGSGSAANYALRYVNGLLVVLPKPPRIGEADEGGGGQALAVALTDEQIADIARAQDTQERNGSQLAPWRRRDLPSVPATPVTAQASPADIALLLAGDGTRITLPTLQKLPLISFDPALRRPQAAEPAAAGR